MKFPQIIFLTIVLCGNYSIAQIGMGNTNPKAMLDITASNSADPANTDGLLIPRVDNLTASPGANQDGMMVFLTTDQGADLKGFYYWNNSLGRWMSVIFQRIDNLLDGISDFDGSDDGSSIFLGTGAGVNASTANKRNIGLGYNSLNAVTVGGSNVGIGYNSLYANVTGWQNTAIGRSALKSYTVGNNTAIGYQAMQSSTSAAIDNTAIGNDALADNITGVANTAIGFQSTTASTINNYNTAVGSRTLNFTGYASSNNTAVGYDVMSTVSTGNNNTGMGSEALVSLTTGKFNVAIGSNALSSLTTANINVAIGSGALAGNIANKSNIAVGTGALSVNQQDSNLAIGSYSLFANTTANDNVAIGASTMDANTTGSDNVAVGVQALQKNVTGVRNVAIGAHAGLDGVLNNHNVFIGSLAGRNTSADDNVFIGYQAGFDNQGNDNVAVGYNAGYNNANSGNVFIGHNAANNATADTKSNTLWVEDESGTQPLLYGNFTSDFVAINWDATAANPTRTFAVNGDAYKSTGAGGNWIANSDSRLKKNIRTIAPDKALEMITKLRGVTYEWDDDITGIDRPDNLQYGFIAQELNEVFPEKISKDNQGYYMAAYGDYDALFVQVFKELEKQVIDKDDKIEALENKLSALILLSKNLESNIETEFGIVIDDFETVDKK